MRVDDVTIDSKELGHLLKKIRKEKCLSQEKAARELGCSVYTISKIERGVMFPGVLTLYKMSSLYGFSIDRVLSKVCSGEG